MTRYIPIMLLYAVILTSCATVGDTSSQAAPLSPVARDSLSRAEYLYSRAHLANIEGDYPAALSLLRDAVELDPSSPFLLTAIAKIKLKIGQVQEAMEYIDKAIKLDPSNREPYVVAGSIMGASEKDKEAVKYLREAVKLDPGKEDAGLQLAISLTRLFEYEEAVNTLKELVKKNSDSVLGYYYLGRTYSQMRLYRDAIGYFKKALELRPDFKQASIDMAATYEAIGDYPQAIEIYGSLLDKNENAPPVLQHLIQILIQQRRFKDALEYLDLAAKTGLGGQETMRKIGLIHLELEQYDEAVKIFRGMLEKDPAVHQIRLYLGIAYEEKNDIDNAYAEFSRIPGDSPVYVDAIGHLAFILKEKGKTDQAVDILKNAIAAGPGQIELYLNLSALYEAIDKPETGLGLLLDTEKRFASDTRVQFRLGVLYDKLGKRQESIERMKKVLALNPKDAQALNFLGYTYAEMGTNLDEALGYLKQAVELRPNDGFFLDSLGWVYYKMKNYDEAVKYLEEATSLIDDDSTISEHLGDAYLARHEIKKALKSYKKALEIDPDRKELLDKIRKVKGEPGEK